MIIRWIVRAVLGLALVVAVLAAALPWLAEPALRLALDYAGIEDVAFEDARLGLHGLEIRGLEVGAPGTHRVERVVVRFDPMDLLGGQIESIAAGDAALVARWKDGGLEIPGLEGRRGGGSAGFPAIPLPRRLVLEDASIRVELPFGEAHLPVRAEIEPGAHDADVSLIVHDAELVTDRGRVLARLELDGRLPVDRAPVLADLVATGTLRIDVQDFHLPGHASGITGDAVVAFDVADGAISARSEQIEVAARELGPRLRELAGALPPPWRARLATPEAPLELTLAAEEDGWRASLDGRAKLQAATPAVTASASARLSLADDLTLREIEAGSASVALLGLGWQGFDIEEGRLDIDVAGTPDDLSGRARLDLAGSGSPVPHLVLEDASLQQTVTFEARPGRLAVNSAADGTLRIKSVALRGRLTGGPVTARLRAAEDAPLLAVEIAEDGRSVAWRHAVLAEVEAFTAAAASDGGPVPLSGQVARLEVALRGDGSGLKEGRVAVADASLRLPEQAIRLDGLAATLALDAGGLESGEAVPVTVAEVRHDGDPPWFRPLSLDGTLRPDGDALAFAARVSAADGAATLAVEGRHDPVEGAGRVAIDLAPVTFRPGGLQPVQLAPVLGRRISAVSGQVSLSGDISWSPSGVGGQAALLVEDLGLSAGPVSVERINGLVRLDELWPPSTPAAQQLAIGQVDIGLPLTDGVMTFEVLPEPALAIETLRFDWAGGVLRAAPFTIGSAPPSFDVVLEAEALDLTEIFELVRLEGLTGEGVVSGTLPVRIEGGEAVIEGGELAAEGPGWLRYRPGDLPAVFASTREGTDLLLEALENFHYEELRITLDGRTDAEMNIGLHLSGANPGLYDGYPIEFNLNLEGELANVLRSGLSNYQIPERVRERMQEYRR